MTMQMLMADERWAGRKEGLQEGTQNTEKRIVMRMFRRGKSVEDIAQDTDIPVEAVRDILKTEGLLN